jgi:predicted regulator of Ras-like GTPase activity (Roadblock/LC7/MglB family)
MNYRPQDLLKAYLQNIKNINGVENVVLTQRDGFPINSAGVWLSKKEIFNVSSAASAIYAVAENISNNQLNNILVEGANAKIFLSPLPSSDEYFITLTTKSKANLGAIYVEARNSFESLQKILLSSDLDLKPPLRFFKAEEIKEIIDNFSLKDQQDMKLAVSNFNFIISEELAKELEDYISAIVRSIPEINKMFISLNGGHVLSYHTKQGGILDKTLAAMTYSLYDTASRVFWILKRSNIEAILCESEREILFIYGLKNAILTIGIRKKENVRIGLLRLLFASYVKTLDDMFINLAQKEKQVPVFSIENLIESLVVK